MPSWGLTDTPDNQPVWLKRQHLAAGTKCIFITVAQAQMPDYRAKGFKSPGWWLTNEWTDSSGSTRHNNELLVAFPAHVPAAVVLEPEHEPEPVVESVPAPEPVVKEKSKK